MSLSIIFLLLVLGWVLFRTWWDCAGMDLDRRIDETLDALNQREGWSE